MTVSVVPVDVELLVGIVGIVGIGMVDIGDVTPVMERRVVRQESSLQRSVVALGGGVVLLLRLRNRAMCDGWTVACLVK